MPISPVSQSLNQLFPNLKSTLGQPQAASSPSPQASGAPMNDAAAYLKRLGPQTTAYGGQTKFEGFHKGVDIAAPINTPLQSLTEGKVVSTVTGRKPQDMSGYGNSVIVQNPDGKFVRYSHLSNVLVKPGDVLKKGQQLGAVGNTGSSYSVSGGTGSHLDIRIYDAAQKYYNPWTYLSGSLG